MILKLDHTVRENAEHIRAVFQASYVVEAKLLKAVDFPPLKRPINGFLQSQNEFYGYHHEKALRAAIELKQNQNEIHIQSLVVHPDYFRQGIANSLLQFVLALYKNKSFTVETGLANTPAKRLYKSFGFVKTREWDTDHDVRKVAFELIR